MRENGASAVAIVDDDGKLVDVLSVSDLRLIGHDLTKLERVTRTVEEFSSFKTTKVAPVVVYACDTVAYVTQRLLENKIHRLYVVDGENKPIGVVTLGDFLHLFVEQKVKKQ